MAELAEGLRERKKQRTREAIVDAALRLFDERGFEHTTIADIAHEADIAPRTFFGYFPSKEDVVFHDFEDLAAGLERRLRDRESGETAADALRAWLTTMLAETDRSDERERRRHRILRDTPTLQAHERVLRGRFEAALADAVAVDLDAEPGSLRPRMVAASFIASLEALKAYDGEEVESQRDPIEVLDEALTFLRGGMRALQKRPHPGGG